MAENGVTTFLVRGGGGGFIPLFIADKQTKSFPPPLTSNVYIDFLWMTGRRDFGLTEIDWSIHSNNIILIRTPFIMISYNYLHECHQEKNSKYVYISVHGWFRPYWSYYQDPCIYMCARARSNWKYTYSI